ncbi:MAG: tetratricopeptide repeat protein [Myxococcota bacterium]
MIAWLAAVAVAEVPLPSFRDLLAHERWTEVNEVLEDGCTREFPIRCTEGAPDRAIALVDGFQDAVVRDAGLEYLAGLANRYAGRESEAIRRYEAALALDPSMAEAWYDLGEIHMGALDIARARDAFEHVRDLRTEGDLAWIGSWRLAEVSALDHDAAGLERNLRDALRRGFTFRTIAGQPNWKAFYADPALTDTIDKLLTVYAEPGIRDSLR